MGWYTDVVVHVSILENDDEQDNLRLLPELQAVARLFPVPDCSHFYAGTTKGSHIDVILKGIGAIKWEYPEDVQVWYKDEHDETFRLVMGVEEQDKRIVERDRLLYEAWDLLMDVQVFIPPENYDLTCVKNWIEKYKQLKGEE